MKIIKSIVCFLTVLLVIICFTAAKAYSLPLKNIVRICKDSVYETSAAISQKGWDKSQYIIICSGDDESMPVDALASISLSKCLNAPIMFTAKNSMNTYIVNEIKRLCAQRAIIIGGYDTVSYDVQKQLEEMNLTVERLGGKDRNHTSVEIAKRVNMLCPSSTAILSSSQEIKYGIMSSPVSYPSPLLYTDSNKLPDVIESFLKELKYTRVIVIGDSSIISDSVLNEIKDMNIDVERIEGDTLRQANMNIISKFCENDIKTVFNCAAIVPEGQLSVAISGAALAAKENIPVLMTGREIDDETSGFISSHNIESCIILGCYDAVSSNAADILFGSSLQPPQNISHTAEYYTPGNSSGNIINSGIACENDGYIYFSDSKALYKINAGDSPPIKICDDRALYINVSGKSIFYSNGSDNYCIYSINTDGTGRKKISADDADFITVSGSWIYYINSDDLKLYRIKTDGTGRTKISEDESCFLNIYGNWLYYTTDCEQNKVYRINLENMVREELLINNISCIDVQDGSIYYVSADDNFCLYKMELPNMNKPVKLTNYGVKYINALGDWIYFADYKNGTIHSMKIDGSSDTELNTDNSSCINIAGGWIYFYNFSSWPEIFRMKTDGSMKHKVIVEK